MQLGSGWWGHSRKYLLQLLGHTCKGWRCVLHHSFPIPAGWNADIWSELDQLSWTMKWRNNIEGSEPLTPSKSRSSPGPPTLLTLKFDFIQATVILGFWLLTVEPYLDWSSVLFMRNQGTNIFHILVLEKVMLLLRNFEKVLEILWIR